jgi:hypothetical protein
MAPSRRRGPEQRVLGVDAKNDPRNGVGDGREDPAAEAYRGRPPNAAQVPGAAVSQCDLHALLGAVVLLIGDVRDELFVDSPPGNAQIDRVHGERRPPLQ